VASVQPPPDDSVDGYLANYGFIGLTNPDPTGANGQGADNDANIAAQAVQWLQRNSKAESPYCLTVSFVNPHDKQFFWAGSEADRYYPTFEGKTYKPYIAPVQPGAQRGEPVVGRLPGAAAQLGVRRRPGQARQARCPAGVPLVPGARLGGTPDRTQTDFESRPSPCAPRQLGVGIAPSDYWQRGLDMYTLVQTMVDEQIGRVIAAVPRKQLGDTVFVFASDHGEYAGAHGVLSGKIGSAYEEAIRIPLIVTDPSRRFTKHVQVPRRQLASSVDVAPMLVTLGNRGDGAWMRGRYAKIYGERLNLVELLSDPRAAGRDHVLFATDEILPNAFDYLHAPTHVLAVRTRDVKLVTYSHWARGTTTPIRATMKLEFYDYATASGRAETESTPDDPRVKPLLTKLLDQYAPTQMEAPLPGPLRATSRRARASYLVFSVATNAYTYSQLIGQGKLKTVLGYGGSF
jgi:arylsulfatase A-like enzyme